MEKACGKGSTHAIGELTLQTIRSFRIGNSQSATGARWKQRYVYAHRRAHPDRFPIGLWTGTPDTFAMQRRVHIDTIVQEVGSNDSYYAKHIPRYGFRTIVPNGAGRNKAMMKDLGSEAWRYLLDASG